MEKSYVYILTNKRNGTLYTGVTSNLIKRVYEHKNKLIPGFTAKYAVNKLIYFEEHREILIAIHREKCIKRWKRGWKIELIEEFNPDWKDLYPEIIDPG